MATSTTAAQPAVIKAPKENKNLMNALSVISIIGGLGIWWAISASGWVRLPTPPAVAEKYVELLNKGYLQKDIAASMSRVFAGFFIGTGLAIPLGFLMGWYRPVRAILEPWTQFFRTVPPLALLPLVMVLMGIGEAPKIFVISLAAFLVSIVATFQGVLNVDKTLINAGRVLGANDWVIFSKIAVPASLPFITVGMRQGLGASWATLVASELLAAQWGLGSRMQKAMVYVDIATVFVGVVTIGVFGLVMDRIVLWIDTKLTSWQERR